MSKHHVAVWCPTSAENPPRNRTDRCCLGLLIKRCSERPICGDSSNELRMRNDI